MAYTRVNWQNSPSHATPLSAENLNVMDAGIAGLDAAVTEAEGDISSLETTVEGHTSTISGLQTTVGEHTADIGNMEDDISDLQTTVSGHTTSIGNLETSVEGNTSDISDLKEDLEQTQTQLDETTALALAALPQETIENVAIASFDDGGDGVPVKELKIAIEPIQSGSGNPSPTNIRPISGRSSVTVTRTGKNLFNVDAVQSLASFGFSRNGVVFDKPGTYTVSGHNGAYRDYLYARVLNADGTTKQTYYVVVDTTMNNATFSISNGETFLVYDATNHTIDESKSSFNRWQCQVEVGSTATTYEPYTADTYLIPLSSTIYGGTLDVGTGTLTVDRAIRRFSGSDDDSWVVNVGGGTDCNRAALNLPDALIGVGATPIISDKFQYLPQSATLLWHGYVNNNGVLLLGVPTDITDKTTMNAWVAENIFDIVYKVETPTTVQLTPTQVYTLLKDNNIFCDSGDVKKLIYRADLGLYIQKLINA